jgi:glycosyltransferase involved in cell wall biosynthesis
MRNARALKRRNGHSPIKPLLSIIIIARNEERCLPRLLDAINRQTYDAPFEVIVSDVSTDRTPDIARSYGCRVIKGGLPAAGRNRGAASARGSILLFLDADVSLPRNFLTANLEEIERARLDIGVPFSVPMSRHMLDRLIWTGYNAWLRIVERLDAHGTGHCIFCRRELFLKAHGFDERVAIGEDHNFVRRCGRQGRYGILRAVPILVSVRRWEREGRLRLLAKYLHNGVYRLFMGEMTTCPFDYEMNGINLKDVGKKKL